MIASDIGHLVFNDQVVLRVHGGLYVVAYRSGSFAAAGHGTGIRICKG
jgi:hypothetical protein